MSEHKFKPGDRVRCVDSTGLPLGGEIEPPRDGVIASIVEGPRGCHVRLVGQRRLWSARRFEPLPAGYIPRDHEDSDSDATTRTSKQAEAQSSVAPAVEETGQPDVYTAHRLSRSDETARELTDARAGNVEARARLVAALAKELDRPVPVRFPAEGRSDRVFGGRRW